MTLVTFANQDDSNAHNERVLSYGSNRIQSGEVLFLSLYVDKYYLSEVFAIKSDNGVLLELQSFFSALDFAITSDDDGKRYSGWYIEQAQVFSLNLTTLRVRTGQAEEQLNAQDIMETQGEVYVDATLLAKWFKLHFNINYQDLKLKVFSEQKLPIEMRLARQDRRFAAKSVRQSSVLPWKETPYQVWSPPLFDIQASLNTTNESDTRLSVSMLGSQDLAYWNANYFLSGRNGNLLDEGRVNITREEKEGIALGPLTINKVEAGDILGTRIGGEFVSTHARGLRISDRPLFQEIDTQAVRISGAIQVGWDVELYHNGLMIDQRLSVQSGLYDFEHIELYFGSNEFELIMYGPQGQVLRDSRSYYVAGSRISAGNGYFDASLVDVGKTLLGTGISTDSYTGWNLLSRYDYGVSDALSFYSGTRIALEGQENAYQLNTGLVFDVWKKGIINFDYSHDERGERIYQLQGRTQINQHAISAVVSDKKSRTENENAQYNRVQDLALRVSGRLYQNSDIRLNYQNTLNWRKNLYGSDFIASNLLSVATRFGTLSHQLDYTQPDGEQASNIRGIARWQGRVGSTYGRVGVGYMSQPDSQLTDYHIQLSRVINSQLGMDLDYTKSLLDDNYEIEAGLNWHNDKFRLTGQFSYFQNNDWQFGLTGQFSLGYESYSNEFFISDRRLASSGSVLVKVYLDQNNNAKFDGNDVMLEGVRIKSLQGFAQAFTDSKGTALLGNMPLNRQTDIVLDADSLPDPFYISAHDGRSITPRKGFIAYLEYPVVHAGELEGIAYQKDLEGNEVPLPYAEIELVNEYQQVIDTVKTAYDGYYVFSGIRPGNYETRVKKHTSDQFKQTEKVEVAFSSRGDVLLEVDMMVEHLPNLTGYVAVLGQFDSLTILKAYATIVTKKIPPDLSNQTFFMHDKKRNKYLLGYGYSEQEGQAASACLNLQRTQISCNVEPISVVQ
ncbi:hypothetical protein L1077_01535 [Pseudoalteromonas luteoviolacea]|uniref:hypothetical protein n=1 Tax=Pseudoalteromonas luteoviolacea TaxID=43657 RepID=UPI001F2484EA|nr:hypothetical protein [Pseudoalteromonas luteoviolacea]MCF6438113.1 hypothetical protein [Pseudoalteromonas luteoviolacea]